MSAAVSSPRRFHLIFGLVAAALGTLLFWWLFKQRNTWTVWIASWLLSINLVVFLYYGFDKIRAANEQRRVPEMVLLLLQLLGGSIGGFLAMQVFRHKTQDRSFRFFFWLIAVAQVVLIAWIVKIEWWDA